MNRLWRTLRVLFQRRRFDSDLEEEMQAHIEMQSADNLENGMSARQAELAARRQFGNATFVAEESRAAWGWTAVERFTRDVRFGIRLLMRNPGFTTAAVLTLALGIGANSAMFSLVDAFLFRPAPVKDLDRLVSIATRDAQHSGWPISYPNFVDWQRDNQVFEKMAAYRAWSFVFADGSGADRTPGMAVTSGFFEFLGMHPVLGRTFLPEEHRDGAAPVCMISYELWQRHFGGDPGVLGRTITILGSEISPIVGVAAPGFRIGPRADIYSPLERHSREGRGSANSLYAVARLKPGVSWEQARAQMDAVAARLEQLYPETNKGQRLDLMPFGQLRRREVRTPLLMLLGAVGLVLLIACANLSNLLLAKAAGRGREVIIRKALGASRPRLVSQMLTESLVLAALGCAAGLLLGYWASRGLLALAGDLNDWPGGEPLGGIGLDGRVFLFTLAISLLTGLAMGLVPALHASRASLTSRGSTRESRHTLDLLVSAEVALALVLLSGAGLLMRSLFHLMTQERGFDARQVLTFSLAPTEGRQTKEACERVMREIEAIPGVESVAGSFPMPFGHGYSGDYVWPEGRPHIHSRVRYVTPGYFRTLRIPLRAGRWVTAADFENAAVINEVLARKAFPGQNAVGRRFRLGVPKPTSDWITVAGVSAATRENGLEDETEPEAYLPVSGRGDILVRARGNPLSLIPAIRTRIRAGDPNQAVYDIFPLEDRISESLRGNRTLAWLLGMFAGMAALLAAVGIYGVISNSVSGRTQEMGVRIALGAEPSDVRDLVLRQGMVRVAAGLAVGAVLAWASTGLLRSFLYGVTPTDPVTLMSVAALLGAVSLAACYIPARRATRIDPVNALRHE
jgi:predicted permease